MNKYALVTGSNRGLGLGFVKTLIIKGFTVFACTRDISSYPLKNEKVIPIQLNVTDDSSIQQAFKDISNYTDKLKILVNNAGVSKDTVAINQKEKVSNIEDLDRELLLRMININTISPFIIIKTFLPLLNQSTNSFVINISSARASYKDEWGFESINLG